ncbi:hypothetical protein ABEB36_005162 [Hypothenemus hampei]|uniref:Uncharacterized protein n=1 Tax=Hypothenemus hampei TaxID=57062 RepID=A0ABD1EX74_HYPHA
MLKGKSICYPEECLNPECSKRKFFKEFSQNVPEKSSHFRQNSKRKFTTDSSEDVEKFLRLKNKNTLRERSVSYDCCWKNKQDKRYTGTNLSWKHISIPSVTSSRSDSHKKPLPYPNQFAEETEEEVISVDSAEDIEDIFQESSIFSTVFGTLYLRIEIDKEKLLHFINTLCFRTYFGPSLDETTVLTMEALNRLLRWCGFLINSLINHQ